MDKKGFFKVTAYAAIFGLVGGMTFEGVNYVADKVSPVAADEATVGEDSASVKIPTVSTTQTSQSSDSTDGDVSDVSDEVLPSIVAINVTIEQEVSDFFGQTYTQQGEGSGSGIIVGQDDDYIYIVSNNHVVEDATNVSVVFVDDSVYTAEVKGTDSSADLAVIQIKTSDLSEETLNNIKVATLGDSDEV
nr:S1C family serine protease [Lachnospiraceae bacterium]